MLCKLLYFLGLYAALVGLFFRMGILLMPGTFVGHFVFLGCSTQSPFPRTHFFLLLKRIYKTGLMLLNFSHSDWLVHAANDRQLFLALLKKALFSLLALSLYFVSEGLSASDCFVLLVPLLQLPLSLLHLLFYFLYVLKDLLPFFSLLLFVHSLLDCQGLLLPFPLLLLLLLFSLLNLFLFLLVLDLGLLELFLLGLLVHHAIAPGRLVLHSACHKVIVLNRIY